MAQRYNRARLRRIIND